MLPPFGALLAHLSLAAVCYAAARLVAVAAGPSPVVARRLRRVGAGLAILFGAGLGAVAGSDAHVAGWLHTVRPGLAPDVYPTVGTLALFCGPVVLTAYAAYRGADDAAREGSPGGFGRGYAVAVGPALALTALSPAVPDGWWLAVGVAAVGLFVAAGSPLAVRRLVANRPLSPHETRGAAVDLPVYVLRTGVHGPANALAAGLLPGLRCVFVTERLVATLSERELAAILTHELGHHRRHHVALRLGAVAAFVLPWLAATALEVPGAFETGLLLAVPATLGILRLVRWTEYDADDYAARHVGAGAMRDALLHLAGGYPRPPGAFSGLSLHPPLATRIDRLDPERCDTPRPEGHAGD
jgi:Zn-dependent protease with chaperone function